MQVDVVESNFSELSKNIRQSHNFIELERAHEKFLNALLAESFLDINTLVTTIETICKQAQALCRAVESIQNLYDDKLVN